MKKEKFQLYRSNGNCASESIYNMSTQTRFRDKSAYSWTQSQETKKSHELKKKKKKKGIEKKSKIECNRDCHRFIAPSHTHIHT